jgi:hypothetical protein
MNSPTRLAGGLLIEVGGILLALMVLPIVPWDRWKALLAPQPEPVLTALPPTIPETRFAFQYDGQPRRLEERSFTQPWSSLPPAAQQPPTSRVPAEQPPALLPFADAPSSLDKRDFGSSIDRYTSDRTGVDVPRNTLPPADSYYAPQTGRSTNPRQSEYVAETLDRASQRMLESLVGPWKDRPSAPLPEPPPTQSYARPLTPPTTAPTPTLPPSIYSPPAVSPPASLSPPAVSVPPLLDSQPAPSNRFQPMLDRLQSSTVDPPAASGASSSPTPQTPSVRPSQLRQQLPRSIHY